MRRKKNKRQKAAGHLEGLQTSEANVRREKYVNVLLLVVLLAFGVYHSFIYFGHKAVPNSDYTAFFNTGHRILLFEHPGSFKRAPVLGILQSSLSYIVGGRHPDLTAVWVLNAILHPFNIVLLWLVGNKIIGCGGKWFSIFSLLFPLVMH